MNELALFAGAGGGILGGKLLGWNTVCAAERDAYAAQVLAQRQNDRMLEPFPIWSDVTTFDGTKWRGLVDVVSGGFPCQDISTAGSGKGLDGERSGLWSSMFRIIREVRPGYVFVENSPILTSRGLGIVLANLAEIGYDAEWDVFGAHDMGLPIQRNRIWILASSRENGRVREGVTQNNGVERKRTTPQERSNYRNEFKMVPAVLGTLGKRWNDFPDAARNLDGVAYWVDRLACTGNGQVPAVAKLAWNELHERLIFSNP